MRACVCASCSGMLAPKTTNHTEQIANYNDSCVANRNDKTLQHCLYMYVDSFFNQGIFIH